MFSDGKRTGIQLTVWFKASFAQIRRQTENKSKQGENQLELKKASIPSIKTIIGRVLLSSWISNHGPELILWKW